MRGPAAANAVMKIKWLALLDGSDSPVQICGGVTWQCGLACDCTSVHMKSFVFEERPHACES